MEVIRKPLTMTEAENRAALKASEQWRERDGNEYGNRHERRLAAKRARQQRRRQPAPS